MIPKIETQSLEDIIAFQEKKLQAHLQYLKQYSPFYKQLFVDNHIDTSKIRKLEDLIQIPATTKKDLQLRNFDFLCVDPGKIVDFITTSGTLGDPVTFAMTDKDLDRLAYNEAISFACAGCGPDDIIQLTTTIDKRFMAGLAYFLGARKLGSGIIRVGAGIPELQWDTIERMHPTSIVAVPSFLLKLIEYAEAKGIDYQNSSLKRAICIGEVLRNPDFSLSTLSEKIKEKWPLDLISTYASTEMSTAFCECGNENGGHHHPELIIPEFLDENGKPVKEGDAGELTVTTLGVEGMPLLRYRTGDICHFYTEPCSCGRNTIRLGPVIGRKNQMIKFKGTTLYPPSLYNILDGIDMVLDYVVEVYTNEVGTDEILIHTCLKSEDVVRPEKIIKDHFRAKLRVSPSISFINKNELNKIKFPENSRKAISFIDKRNPQKD